MLVFLWSRHCLHVVHQRNTFYVFFFLWSQRWSTSEILFCVIVSLVPVLSSPPVKYFYVLLFLLSQHCLVHQGNVLFCVIIFRCFFSPIHWGNTFMCYHFSGPNHYLSMYIHSEFNIPIIICFYLFDYFICEKSDSHIQCNLVLWF